MQYRIRAALILLALLASSLCYIYGYVHQREDAIYTGMRSLNASDYSTHLSWIDQSRQGLFFLKNQFTAVPQGGDLVRPVYFLLSQPFRLTSISNPAVFHILRFVCGAALLVLLFPMLQRFESNTTVVNRAFLLLAFTSGLGFAVRQWIPSADMDVPESILFVSLGEAPHFIYSLLFLWGGIVAFFAGLPAIYFVCLLFLWWEHPFEAVILICVCMANLWVLKARRVQVIVILITAGISIPPFFYYQHLKTLPAFSGWGSAQNFMSSPPFYSYLSAFLPLMLLSIRGFLYLRGNAEKRRMLLFLITWVVAQFVLAYLPFSFQRRLIAGVQFPLAVLAAYGLVRIRKPVVAGFIVLLLSMSNLVITKKLIDELRPRQMPFYFTASYQEAFQWLTDHENKDGIVVSGFVTGNLIPGFSGFASYLGHSSLTPEVAKKRVEVREFFEDPTMTFVLRNRVRYIFWGLEERTLSREDLSLHFGTAFSNEQVTILDPHLKIENMNIVVGGHTRNIGKTSVVAGIIEKTREQNWTAIKVTQFGHGVCSRNGKACHCSTEEHKYAILDETDPNGRGDTCRFLAAGAKRSVWVRTKQGMLHEAMPEIEAILKEQNNTIIESNSILEFFKPDLYFVVLDYSNPDFKQSSKKFLSRADACILVNPRPDQPVWEGIPAASFAGKPLFEITPPHYVDSRIVEFIRKHSARKS